jgi:hypothetical protein
VLETIIIIIIIIIITIIIFGIFFSQIRNCGARETAVVSEQF